MRDATKIDKFLGRHNASRAWSAWRWLVAPATWEGLSLSRSPLATCVLHPRLGSARREDRNANAANHETLGETSHAFAIRLLRGSERRRSLRLVVVVVVRLHLLFLFLFLLLFLPIIIIVTIYH